MRLHVLFLAAAALTAAASPALAEGAVHVVEPGETLNGIANRAGVSPAAIARANDLDPPYVVRIGQKLSIPRDGAEPAGAGGFYEVTSGETLIGIANRSGVSAKALAEANGLEPPYIVRVGQKLRLPGKTGGSAATVRTAARTIPARASTGTPPEEETLHIVTPGETLGGIAARAKVPRVLIAEANGLAPPFTVRVGQELKIPRTRRHEVKAGDTGFSISYKYAVPWEQIATANGIDPEAPVRVGQNLLIPTLLNPPVAGIATPAATPAPVAAATASPAAVTSRFLWPVNGSIRREYSTGSNYHDGLDISAPKGAMVRAAAAGTVKFAGQEKEQFGNLVVLDHGAGWFTAYGFLSRITVKQGAKVAAGERIGLVGNTGLAKGNELHFEVRKDGKPVDPTGELPKAP
ncbi:peptidase M23 [Novosphingobium endophyticum]|uniref:Peptidase M23 n=1 Tax=Novosphingobium endophyticum TaxID=1955250 RepID=A0A916TQB6_9SPHN|nr:LysM peptidoglycan-binding domain-containing protein [Novosphingobium endophyticum]GGB90479.1 peptidase M23 [Novosphingobium endophyticum]